MSSAEYPSSSPDLLASYYEILAAGVEAFIANFYRTQEAIPERAQVLSRLSPERYRHLRTAQVRHLCLLLNPEMEASWHEDAHLAGQLHYRHGVLPSWVADSYALYWRHLLEQVERPEIAAGDRHSLRALLVGRLLQDLAWQLEGYAEGYGRVRDLLLHLDHLLVGADSEATMLPQIMDFLIRGGGVDGAWLGHPDSNGKIVFTASAGEGMAEYLATITISIDDTPEGQGPAGRAWRTKEVQITPDWGDDSSIGPWREQAQPFGWNSSAAIPLVDSGGRRRILALMSRERGFFGHSDQQLILAHLAAVLGLAMERLHLIAKEVSHREALERLNTLYHALMAEGDILLRAHNERELLRETCRRLAISHLFTTAWVGRPNEDGVMKYLATAGRGAQAIDSIHLTVTDAPEGQNLAARAWRSGRLQYSNDHLADPSLALLHEQFRLHRWCASVAIPILRQGLIWGVLVAIADRAGVFDEAILELLARIARLLSHGLDEIDLRASVDAEHVRQAWLAHHDPLTGLPNRVALSLRMAEAMARTARHERILAVGMLDLDDFKPINDQYGHAAGDILLATLADRLRKALRQTDFAARLGGDEFVLIFEDLRGMDDLELVLARIQGAIEEPFILPGGDSVTVHGSLGLTLYPIDDGDPDLLLRHADQALYTIKEAKRNRQRFWAYYHADTDVDEETALRQSMSALFAAGGLRVHYQPIIDLESRQVVGVEALARLVNGTGEILAPARFLSFLSINERRALTRAVLAQALQDIAAWEKAGFPLTVSVNAEPELLAHDACLHCLAETVGPSGIDPARITLEILEYGDFLSIASAQQRLSEIKATGVCLALDDIGSAYSSLLRLKELPIDKIKLDQNFVRELAQRPDNLHFVHSLLSLAQGLGVDFIAEGAETPEILDALSALGAAQAQGYAIARPMPAPEILPWLQAHTPTPWHGPQSLLGLYASHLRFSDTVKTLLQQVPRVSESILSEITATSPVTSHMASLGLGSTPLAQAYLCYQEAVAVFHMEVASGKPDFTAIDKTSAQFLECIREMLVAARQ
ncbi:MAG: EAL domain-containing protein [Acidithiobacillus sp.]